MYQFDVFAARKLVDSRSTVPGLGSGFLDVLGESGGGRHEGVKWPFLEFMRRQ